MSQFVIEENAQGLKESDIRLALQKSLEERPHSHVLLLPPDFTRYYSNAGLITNLYYHMLTEQGCEVDILPALGSHFPVSREEADIMYGDIPYEKLIPHNWRTEVVKLGEVPGDYIAKISEGIWTEPISVEINRRVMDPCYDLIISIGQVVPHEVVGMGNYSKNLFVGVGGNDMINKSHLLGAFYGLERILGRDHSPVRELFDYSLQRFLGDRPLLFVLTVCTVAEEKIRTHGLFIGEERDAFEAAVAMAQEKNMTFLPHGLKKCVAFLDPREFKSSWVGNKALYRTRMAMCDDGELIILAPGIRTFGEDPEANKLIRKYGYCGRQKVIDLLKAEECEDLRQNMATAAHLIHGSVDGRFHVTYAVQKDMMDGVRGVCYEAADYNEVVKKYDPKKMQAGWNTGEDGEEFFYVPNPGIGLWINQETFQQ